MASLKDKVAIITGGYGFLGQQYAKALENSGAKVVLWDSNAPDGKVDITKESEVEGATQKVVKNFGRIDILINNAAMNPAPNSPESADQFLPYHKYPLDLWKRELDVGITGAFICTKAVATVMIDQMLGGSIINIGSHYGTVAPDNRIYPDGMFKSIAYATVKGAMPNFTRAWAAYLGMYGIRVNCLVLGGVFRNHDPQFLLNYSRRTMVGRMARPHEYNEAVLFLASDASSYMTGQMLIIDGGWTAL